MFKTILKKLVELILVMLAATLLTFFLTWLSPGDPAEIYYQSQGIAPSEAMLAATRVEMGVNDPFFVQYWHWLTGIASLDAGVSYRTGESVTTMVHHRFFMTLRLAIVAITMMFFLSFLLGIIATLREAKPTDYVIRFLSFISVSIPEFWLGLMLILNCIVYLHWFKLTDPYAPESVILPALTLAIPLAGRYARQIQSMLSDEMTKEYVIGARARGCGEISIVIFHVLPTILGGLITLFGLSCALLLGGTVIVESIFSWPGLGSMAIESITNRDYPVLQAYVLIMVLIYVSINFVADIIAEALDPRLSFTRGQQ